METKTTNTVEHTIVVTNKELAVIVACMAALNSVNEGLELMSVETDLAEFKELATDMYAALERMIR